MSIPLLVNNPELVKRIKSTAPKGIVAKKPIVLPKKVENSPSTTIVKQKKGIVVPKESKNTPIVKKIGT
jgi:hypothetical protein